MNEHGKDRRVRAGGTMLVIGVLLLVIGVVLVFMTLGRLSMRGNELAFGLAIATGGGDLGLGLGLMWAGLLLLIGGAITSATERVEGRLIQIGELLEEEIAEPRRKAEWEAWNQAHRPADWPKKGVST